MAIRSMYVTSVDIHVYYVHIRISHTHIFMLLCSMLCRRHACLTNRTWTAHAHLARHHSFALFAARLCGVGPRWMLPTTVSNQPYCLRPGCRCTLARATGDARRGTARCGRPSSATKRRGHEPGVARQPRWVLRQLHTTRIRHPFQLLLGQPTMCAPELGPATSCAYMLACGLTSRCVAPFSHLVTLFITNITNCMELLSFSSTFILAHLHQKIGVAARNIQSTKR